MIKILCYLLSSVKITFTNISAIIPKIVLFKRLLDIAIAFNCFDKVHYKLNNYISQISNKNSLCYVSKSFCLWMKINIITHGSIWYLNHSVCSN